jgi:cell division protein FtsL
MPEQLETIEQVQPQNPTPPTSKKISWKRWFNYQAIVQQVPFCIFLGLLAVIYIYNGHYADKLIRNINKTEKEVKELQYEYKTVQSEVMFRSQQSELAKAVQPLGLKELVAAPVVLADSVKGNGELKIEN